MLTRRTFLASSAALALSACSSSGDAKPKPPPTATPGTQSAVAKARNLVWSEEFNSLDLASPSNPKGKWRPNDVWQPLDEGYQDFATRATWLVNPAQRLALPSPFSVNDSVLTITARRSPKRLRRRLKWSPWTGGLLVSNTDLPEMTFGYGYYEFKARIPTPGQGMFPALWLYAAHGKNSKSKREAEIDVFEVFGSRRGRPWKSTLHSTRQVDVQTHNRGTAGWHTYGLDWTSEHMHFYYDGRHTASASQAAVRYYRGVKMSIRMDFVVITKTNHPEAKANSDTPDAMHMEIDYIRQYDKMG